MENLEVSSGGGTISNEDNAAGSFTYTPDPNFFGGSVTLLYTPACDGIAGNLTTIFINVPAPFCPSVPNRPLRVVVLWRL